MVKFSIVIPLYNKEKSINSTLQSIINQKYSDYEIIIVDDGSTDSSVSIVRSINNNKIKIYSKENGGVSSARNFGIRHSNGLYCLLFDADDYMMPGALEIFDVIIREKPGYIMYSGNVWNQSGEHKKLRCKKFNERLMIAKTPYKDIWFDRLTTKIGCYVFERKIVDKIGYFDEKLSFFEDFEFAHRLLDLNSVVYTSNPVMSYRMEFANLSGCNHVIEKEFAFYLSRKDIYGGFWREIVFAENVRYSEYIRAMANDAKGVDYYRNMFRNLFSVRCRIYFFLSDLYKRIKRFIVAIIIII